MVSVVVWLLRMVLVRVCMMLLRLSKAKVDWLVLVRLLRNILDGFRVVGIHGNVLLGGAD